MLSILLIIRYFGWYVNPNICKSEQAQQYKKQLFNKDLSQGKPKETN